MKAHDPQQSIFAPQSRETKSLRILCAEDHEQMAMVLKLALERAGHRVDHVEDGLQALERITAAPDFFDVLVTDHQMPRLSGLGLVSKLRDTEFSGAIIVHSSHLTTAEREAYRALAVDFVLNKPAQLGELLAVVQQTAGALSE